MSRSDRRPSLHGFTFHTVALTFTLMHEEIRKQLKAGARVKVTQQIAGRDYTWTSDIRGTIVGYAQRTTGSWFAHSKNDKLWLDRLTLRKNDGELITLNLDEYTHIEIESPGAGDAVGKSNESDKPI